MVNIGLTKISSKGQIVIPSELRGNLKEGEQFIIIQDGDRILLKKAGVVTKEMREDLEFAKRTEEAWKQFERGEFVSKSSEDFLKELSLI